ncbi:MAG: DUF1326 domain-containing protein [Gammaproteobacteria bacterium]|nr:DUF1326 domain-containing protein [Gammaproteobacteria bacterium]MCP5202255.1 DUF1326 domain-containing protein [Gammaproteobacteria bacterium]
MSDWSLKGTYMETCNCDAACPCVFLSDPTQGDCTVVLGWHIEAGKLGGVSLDGLNVAMAVLSPGNMAKVKWKAALYIDETASAEQQQALTTIFGGQAGGHPAALASHVGEILGVSTAHIAFAREAKTMSMKVGDVASATIEEVSGQGGAPVTISGHPLAIAPGFPATLATSKQMEYKDHGMSWSEAGRTAFFSPFAYQG